MFQVIEVNTLEELRTYKLAWEELSARGRSKRFQLSYNWLETYWQHAAPERTLKVLVAILAGKVIGFLPLVMKKTESRLGSINVLTYPLDGWGSWYGPIGPNSAATLTAGMRFLSDSKKGWDLLDLSYTDRDRLDLGRSKTAARNIGWSALERTWQQVPYIQLEASWDEFLNNKKEKTLDRIQQAEATISAQGKINLLHNRSGIESSATVAQLLQGWQEIAPNHSELELIQNMALAAQDSQQLDLSVLTVNEKPVAAALGFLHPQGVEIVRAVTINQQQTEIESVLMSRLLENYVTLGDESCEVTPNCQLAQITRSSWANKVLNSYRYTSSPMSHVRGSILLKYHAATNPKISQKRNIEPLPIERLSQKPAQTKTPQPEKSSFTKTPQLKIYS